MRPLVPTTTKRQAHYLATTFGTIWTTWNPDPLWLLAAVALLFVVVGARRVESRFAKNCYSPLKEREDTAFASKLATVTVTFTATFDIWLVRTWKCSLR